MNIRVLVTLLFFLFSYPSWSITCYYTLAKDNCWSDYSVSVDVIDSMTATLLTTVTVPKGKQWTRQVFPCKAKQTLMYVARYTPVFWQSDIGKTYDAQHSWSLPDEVNPGDMAWNVSVCFPADFSLVPMPPQATNNCKCDFAGIPVLRPGKL